MTEPIARIRQADVADVPILVEARRRMFVDMGDDCPALDAVDAASAAWLAERIPTGAASGLIAEDADGQWIGALSVRHEDTPPSAGNPAGRQSYIFGLWVRHECRRRGVARALVTAAVEDARERGEGAVLLNATDVGRPLYESLGFEVAPAMRLFFDPAS